MESFINEITPTGFAPGPDGQLLIGGVHDCLLIGITAEKKGTLTLGLGEQHGSSKELVFQGEGDIFIMGFGLVIPAVISTLVFKPSESMLLQELGPDLFERFKTETQKYPVIRWSVLILMSYGYPIIFFGAGSLVTVEFTVG
jgi:hypothetical protein